MVLQQIENEGIIDVPRIINRLRQQRMKMVQTVVSIIIIIILRVWDHYSSMLNHCLFFVTPFFKWNQYVFIFDAILESVTCGDTQIRVNDFRQTFKEMNHRNPNTDMNEFQKQFEVCSNESYSINDVQICMILYR